VFTRPFFRHLAGQGHVVMDVAYRLFPETDIAGMAADVKRAIAWMKASGPAYGVDPHKVVLGGASAGGHLALLAAYAPYLPEMTPEDLQGCDLSVRAVVSEYGPTNLVACYFHTNQNKTTRTIRSRAVAVGTAEAGAVPSGPGQSASRSRLGFNKPSTYGAFVNLLGRHPDEIPEVYASYSPDSYVHAGCPPTLQIKGREDLVTPTPAMLDLHQKLRAAGVPSVSVLYPHTDHAFDLVFPQVSPPAQASWYVVDRFLRLVT
jgi:acetyl esterase/lipase